MERIKMRWITAYAYVCFFAVIGNPPDIARSQARD